MIRNMRLLVIRDEQRKQIKKVLEYAEQHHYYPQNEDAVVPGEDPNLVIFLNTFRVVFSYTHADGCIFRHISIGLPGNKLPNPVAVNIIAHSFGFTGWDERKPQEPGADWMGQVDECTPCVAVVQVIAQEGALH